MLNFYSSVRIFCEWFFQIDFGDGSGSGIDFGSLDSGSTAGIDFSGFTIEEGDIDWGISSVEPRGETGNEVCWFLDLPSPSVKHNYGQTFLLVQWNLNIACPVILQRAQLSSLVTLCFHFIWLGCQIVPF